MNKDLLKTPIVKAQIKRYLLDMKLDLQEILIRLFDIHLIEISEEELIEFINFENLNNIQ